MKTRTLLIACLSLLLLAGTAAAEVIPFDIEFGYRWTDIGGNEDLYRSQINEEDGFLLRAFTMNTTGEGFFDHLRIDASDLGAGPAGSLRLEAGSELYRFNLRYRDADAFSALPVHANPFAQQGIIPGQHTFDRNREMLDMELEFLPGRKFTPFIGYSFNNYSGPGQTTYTLGGDEFRLASDLDEDDSELRAGVGLNFSWIYGRVALGWRDFSSDETLTLSTGAGAGNNANPVLGRPITATTITRSGSVDGETPFTNAYFVIEPMGRVRFIVDYVDSEAEADTSETEGAAGSFLSFPLSAFFNSFAETVTSDAENEFSRIGARVEFDLTDNIDIVGGYRSEDRDLGGSAAIQSTFSGAVSFGGVNLGTLQELIDADSSLERSEDVFDIGFQGRAFGPLAFRVAYMNTSQDVDYSPALEEIVVPFGQAGDYSRDIDTLDANVTFAQAGFMFGAAYRIDDADESIVRTDYLDRQRLRVRAGYRTSNDFFRVGLTAEEVDSSNDDPTVNFDNELQWFSGDVELAPIAPLRLRASYSVFNADSSVIFIRPETLTQDISIHLEDGVSIEGGFSLFYKQFSLDADYLTFENEGTVPFDMVRWRARAVFDFLANLGVAAEFNHDDYSETNFPLADYDADRYGLYLRWRM